MAVTIACLTSLSPDCSPPYRLVPMASSSSMKIIAPYTEVQKGKKSEKGKKGKKRKKGTKGEKGKKG